MVDALVFLCTLARSCFYFLILELEAGIHFPSLEDWTVSGEFVPYYSEYSG